MRKTLLLILTFTVQIGFSQSEKNTYDIYSSIINTVVEDWFDKPLESILIVKKFKDKYEEDFSLINELAQDSNPIYALEWLVKDPTLKKRFKEDEKLKKGITKLTSDFKNHPKINIELLRLKDIKVQTISSSRFYSILRRYSKDKKNGWNQIKEKYNTNLVFQFSKIKYNENYAYFYYSYHCGGLCASGNFVIMEKINNDWKVLKNFELWVS